MDLSLTSPPVRSPQAVYDRLVALGASDPDGRPGFLRAFVFEAARMGSLTGINWNWQIAQAAHETADPNPVTGKFGPFNSKPWRERGNPGGIGITDTFDYGYGFPDGIASADAQHAHLYVYVKGNKNINPAVKPELDPRWDAVVQKGWAGTVKAVDDLTGKWATDAVEPDDPKTYGDKLRERFTWVIEGARVDPSVPQPGGPAVAEYSTTIPGLPGGPLRTSFPIEVRLLPLSRSNNRPGIKLRGTFDTTQHATANNASTASGEANYLLGGAEGRQASWHATADETKIVITLPLDEVGWHASDGAGPGNMSTVACELTQRTSLVNNATLWRQARRNAAEFMGRVAARKGGDAKGSFHNDYAPDKKWCPGILLNNATWVREYHSDYAAFYADEKARMAGQAPQPQPQPTPQPTPGATFGPDWGTNAIVRGIGDPYNNVRWEPGLSAGIRDTMPLGEQGRSMYPTPVVRDGYTWFALWLPNGREGWVAGEFLELVTPAPKAPPAPVYATPVKVPALFSTDLQKYDTAQGIVSADGVDWIFVADVIEMVRDTKRLAYANEAAPESGPVAKAGEREIGAWLVKAADGKWYYLLPDPEWHRIAYADTRRVSDAPLLGNEWEQTGEAKSLEAVMDQIG